MFIYFFHFGVFPKLRECLHFLVRIILFLIYMRFGIHGLIEINHIAWAYAYMQ